LLSHGDDIEESSSVLSPALDQLLLAVLLSLCLRMTSVSKPQRVVLALAEDR
jgi:hypothetical protein